MNCGGRTVPGSARTDDTASDALCAKLLNGTPFKDGASDSMGFSDGTIGMSKRYFVRNSWVFPMYWHYGQYKYESRQGKYRFP